MTSSMGLGDTRGVSAASEVDFIKSIVNRIKILVMIFIMRAVAPATG